MNKIRLGMVGCGDIAFRSYLPAIPKLADQAELVATCDIDLARATRAKEEYLAQGAFADAGDMLAKADLDGVLVLTSMVPHGPLCIAALEAGKHVYVEKVMAVDLAEAERMIELAESGNRVLACAPSTILLSAFQELKALVQAGDVGHISLINALGAHFGPARWDGYTSDPTWFYQPGAGPLFDLAVYPVHILTHLFGRVRRVSAFAGLAVPEVVMTAQSVRGKTVQVQTDDTITMLLDFGNTTLATVNVSYNMLASRFPAMQFWGSRGSLTAPQFLGDELGVWHQGDKEWKISHLPPSPYDKLGVAAGLPHWLDCIREGRQPVNNARCARHVLEVLLDAQVSARSGQAVEPKTSF